MGPYSKSDFLFVEVGAHPVGFFEKFVGGCPIDIGHYAVFEIFVVVVLFESLGIS